MHEAETISQCRICGSKELINILDLGKTPLANALVCCDQVDNPESEYDLKLVFCKKCSLVQITVTVPPEILFSNYVYFSSFSDTMLEHAKEAAASLIESRNLNIDSLVVEVASNDGYLLKNFLKAQIPVLGIEPAQNIARVAEENGVPTLSKFFNSQLAKNLRDQGRQADAILGNNVLAHVADLHGFVDGIKILLKKEGVAVFEAPYVGNIIDGLEFDTIYHEHLCYFSLTALDHLFSNAGLEICDVKKLAIHGGSIRVSVCHSRQEDDRGNVKEMLKEEREKGITKEAYYLDFAKKVNAMKAALKKLLAELKSQGHSIAAYGAAAKGATFLNSFGIGKQTLDFVADRSPHKQNKFMPGICIPILPAETLLEKMPDYVLLLSWNFADEILKQQESYMQRGGKFIISIPELRIVSI